MGRTVRIDGLRELDAALGEFPKATGKAVLRRVAKAALAPIAADYRSKVRVDKGHLRDSIGVGTKLTRRQRSMHRRLVKNDKASVEMFAGAGGLVEAITEEFGTDKQAPHPGLRPAWDSGKDAALDSIKDNLAAEIEKAAARLARKAARLAAKG